MLGRVDAISADIAALDARIAEQTAPFADAVARESAGKKKGKGSTGYGNAYLAAILGYSVTSSRRLNQHHREPGSARAPPGAAARP